MTTPSPGTLYLLPTTLGPDGLHTIPAYALEIMLHLRVFVVERAKTARRFLREAGYTADFADVQLFELDKRTEARDLPALLAPALAGHDTGVLSEAGVPGVADPGARIVQLAHQQGVTVRPIVGPSSLLLALMASGMNGQRFTFLGYLSPKRVELGRELQRLESHSARHQETQIFIETPYRNQLVYETVLQSCAPTTLFCIAADLTLATEMIHTHTIHEWRQLPAPDLHKRPAVFLLLGNR